MELKDMLSMAVVVGSWIWFFSKLKHQSTEQEGSIKDIEERLTHKRTEISELKRKVTHFIDRETADDRYVTKRELELTLRHIETQMDTVIKNQEEFKEDLKGVKNG